MQLTGVKLSMLTAQAQRDGQTGRQNLALEDASRCIVSNHGLIGLII